MLLELPVTEDFSVHQLSQMVELLTVQECEDFLALLSHPEESILERLQRLSLKTNQLQVSDYSSRRRRRRRRRHRRRRRQATVEKATCQDSLLDWLLAHGQQIYYDRLSRTLMQIGRSDIAKEVAKDINQDKILSIQRYVDGYHQSIEAMESSLVQTAGTQSQEAEEQDLVRQARDQKDLELVVLHERLPPYTQHVLSRALPLVYGILLGFVGTILAGVPVVLFVLHISRSDRDKLLRKPYAHRVHRNPEALTRSASAPPFR
ncbi:hypothetical protein GN956_G18729 [Arapaima gigas]